MADNTNTIKHISTHINQRDGVSNVYTYKRGNLTFELTKNYCYRVIKEYYIIKEFKNKKVINKERVCETTRISMHNKPSEPNFLIERMKKYQPKKRLGDYETAWVNQAGNIVVKKKLQQ